MINQSNMTEECTDNPEICALKADLEVKNLYWGYIRRVTSVINGTPLLFLGIYLIYS